MNIDCVCFGAKYVSSPKVKVKLKKNTYFPYPVSFVELDPFNKLDIAVIARVSQIWGKLTFACEICQEMEKVAIGLKSLSNKFFALTIQSDNFDKLDEHKLLGIAAVDTHDEKYDSISYIQSHPKYIHEESDSDIKNIGKTLIRSLKKFNNKSLEAEVLPFVEPFYNKCGFKKTERPNVMRWKNPSV